MGFLRKATISLGRSPLAKMATPSSALDGGSALAGLPVSARGAATGFRTAAGATDAGDAGPTEMGIADDGNPDDGTGEDDAGPDEGPSDDAPAGSGGSDRVEGMASVGGATSLTGPSSEMSVLRTMAASDGREPALG